MSFTELIDLASEPLGGAVLLANDEFFAEKENLLRPSRPVWIEGKYTDRGKWMDGWETRRRRTPGHDWAIVRLGLPGRVRGVVIDTSFFRGNFPERASIEATSARPDEDPAALLEDRARWVEILPPSALKGDSQNLFPIESRGRFTHLCLRIFPDGGVARLRVHGEVVPDYAEIAREGAEIDLAALENGGEALLASDMFFGERNNMLKPGFAPNMGDGWETRRRRGPGHDWAIVRLAGAGVLRRLEVDTNHFKGNYPDSCTLEGLHAPGAATAELAAHAGWQPVLGRSKLAAHTRHFYSEELAARGPFTHVRINIFPDGGVSRLRIAGSLTREAARAGRLERLNALLPREAEAELRAACGSSAWARGLAAARPFADAEALFTASDRVWAGVGEAGVREAFDSHPRIGAREAKRLQGAAERRWSSGEQAAAQGASAESQARFAERSAAYEERFGHIFLVCATGKTTDELYAALTARLENTPERELAVAAEEQRKITQLRLRKMLDA